MLRSTLPTIIVVTVLVMVGCTNHEPTAPAPIIGTIIIQPTPEFLNAPWTLQGPEGLLLDGNGESTLSEVSGGTYSIFWGEVQNWNRPTTYTTHTLLPDGNVFFQGLYKEKLDWVLVPPESCSLPVTFTMGSNFEGNNSAHEVTINNRFIINAGEVTNGQYCDALQWAYNQGYVSANIGTVTDLLDGSNALIFDYYLSHCEVRFRDGIFHTSFPNRPVIEVSWFGAASYCDWLSMREGLPRSYDHANWSCDMSEGSGYRLPTETEWEFACRAGTSTHFNTGDCLDSATQANFNGSHSFLDCPSGISLGRMVDVGSYPPNAWGLYDMHGNAKEWCNNWVLSISGAALNAESAISGRRSRSIRGGSRFSTAYYCRSANQHSSYPESTCLWYGFRVVKSGD